VKVTQRGGADQPHRLLEIVGSLPRKPGDHVGPQADPGDLGGEQVQSLTILPRRIRPAHPEEDPVGAALQRDVQVRAETPLRGKEGNERGRDLEGLDRAQAEPAPGSRPEKRLDEPREAVTVAAVGPVAADVDPGQDDLPGAV
jgi:hypothetical protein